MSVERLNNESGLDSKELLKEGNVDRALSALSGKSQETISLKREDLAFNIESFKFGEEIALLQESEIHGNNDTDRFCAIFNKNFNISEQQINQLNVA